MLKHGRKRASLTAKKRGVNYDSPKTKPRWQAGQTDTITDEQ